MVTIGNQYCIENFFFLVPISTNHPCTTQTTQSSFKTSLKNQFQKTSSKTSFKTGFKISVSGKIGDSSLFGEKYKGQNILFLAFL